MGGYKICPYIHLKMGFAKVSDCLKSQKLFRQLVFIEGISFVARRTVQLTITPYYRLNRARILVADRHEQHIHTR